MSTAAMGVLLAVLMFGVNTVLWSCAGSVRWWRTTAWPRGAHQYGVDRPQVPVPRLGEVAVLMAAHNEQDVIAAAIRSAARLIPAEQVFVASDGSTDQTVAIARAEGANVLDLQPNRGKAGALAAGVAQFGLAERFEVVLILDADTELDAGYFTTGLPLFRDPNVSVVAGRATTQWRPKDLDLLGKILVAHRERIYVLVQRMVKYGQAFAALDAVNIAPGFASMYRARVLRAVEMNPPGVVIEDFNMTFEIHRHALGRIAFHPGAAVARTQDPASVREYAKQVRRWALGFWQTVRLHGLLHPGLFWLTLIGYTGELVLSSAVLLVTALLVVFGCLRVLVELTGLQVPPPAGLPSTWELLLVVVVPDFVLSCAVALGQRRAVILAAAPAYPVLRVLDAWLCLHSLAASFRTSSSGRWSSPTRRVSATTPVAPSTEPTSTGGTA